MAHVMMLAAWVRDAGGGSSAIESPTSPARQREEIRRCRYRKSMVSPKRSGIAASRRPCGARRRVRPPRRELKRCHGDRPRPHADAPRNRLPYGALAPRRRRTTMVSSAAKVDMHTTEALVQHDTAWHGPSQHQRYAGQEAQRIARLIDRDGLDAARQWARRTAGIYRSAVLNPLHFAHSGERRRQFIEAYLELKRFGAQR